MRVRKKKGVKMKEKENIQEAANNAANSSSGFVFPAPSLPLTSGGIARPMSRLSLFICLHSNNEQIPYPKPTRITSHVKTP